MGYPTQFWFGFVYVFARVAPFRTVDIMLIILILFRNKTVPRWGPGPRGLPGQQFNQIRFPHLILIGFCVCFSMGRIILYGWFHFMIIFYPLRNKTIPRGARGSLASNSAKMSYLTQFWLDFVHVFLGDAPLRMDDIFLGHFLPSKNSETRENDERQRQCLSPSNHLFFTLNAPFGW